MKTLMHQLSLIGVTSVSLLAGGSVHAQSHSAGQDASEAWRFQVSPYVWAAGLRGDIKPLRNGPSAHVNQSFSDVLGNLDSAFFVAGTARKGRFVMQGDYTYASSSTSASLPLHLTANAEVRQTSLTLTGGYNWQVSP
jgi:hypothetical protein